MKRAALYLIALLAVLAAACAGTVTASAWGDSGGGRPNYTINEINAGALGPVGPDAKYQEGYPGQIIFNTIRDSVMGNEHNFVGAREYTGINAGKENVWKGNEIWVEDGKTYIIRLFVHNNNPNGMDAVAEDVHVSFHIPEYSSRSIQVNGFISSSNATPQKYWDYVDFLSDVPFHLEYMLGSALLENNGIGAAGGLQLSDDIIYSGGIPIGYDALDGRIPGCFQYDAYITIEVKAVYDYGFSVNHEIRLEGQKEWTKNLSLDVGDTVEARVTYINQDEIPHSHVTLSALLLPGLEYVPQSTILYNNENIDGTFISQDTIADPEAGVDIGSCEPGAYAQICFQAKVVRQGLSDGRNLLINGAKVRVGHVVLQSHATIEVYALERLKLAFTVGLVGLLVAGLCKLFFQNPDA